MTIEECKAVLCSHGYYLHFSKSGATVSESEVEPYHNVWMEFGGYNQNSEEEIASTILEKIKVSECPWDTEEEIKRKKDVNEENINKYYEQKEIIASLMKFCTDIESHQLCKFKNVTKVFINGHRYYKFPIEEMKKRVIPAAAAWLQEKLAGIQWIAITESHHRLAYEICDLSYRLHPLDDGNPDDYVSISYNMDLYVLRASDFIWE